MRLKNWQSFILVRMLNHLRDWTVSACLPVQTRWQCSCCGHTMPCSVLLENCYHSVGHQDLATPAGPPGSNTRVSSGSRPAPPRLQGRSAWPKVVHPLHILQFANLRQQRTRGLFPTPQKLCPQQVPFHVAALHALESGQQRGDPIASDQWPSRCWASCGSSVLPARSARSRPGSPALVAGVSRAGTDQALSPLLLTYQKYSTTGI